MMFCPCVSAMNVPLKVMRRLSGCTITQHPASVGQQNDEISVDQVGGRKAIRGTNPQGITLDPFSAMS